MKISIVPVDGGTFVLEQIYNSILLRTREGNEFAICMRNDTVEMKVCLGDPRQDRWYRANMQTGEIYAEQDSPTTAGSAGKEEGPDSNTDTTHPS